MSTNLRIGTISRSLLGTVLVLGGFVACTTQEADTTKGTGGTTTPTGGTTSATGGTTTPTGGSTAGSGVLCPKPATALITDFVATDTSTSTQFAHFGNSTTLGGGEFIYPTTGTNALTSDVSNKNWHITGTVGDYSGFGLYFDNCTKVDASKYKGISFKLSGSVGTGGLIMGLDTLKNTISADWLNAHGETGKAGAGICSPTSGTNQWDQTTCKNFTKTITVSATEATVNVLWSDFTGGKPETPANAAEILSIYWYFAWSGAGAATYPVDITIDDLSFIE